MKILYLSAARLPSEESHSLSIMRVCQAFADQGHEVILSGVVPGDDPPDPIAFYGLRGGFKVVRHELGGIWSTRLSRALMLNGLVLAWKTRGLVRETKPDIVYSRLTLAELAFVPRSAPLVYEMHSRGPLGGNLLRRLSFRCLVKRKNLRRIVVTTKTLVELLGDDLPGTEVAIARLSAERPVEISPREVDDFKEKHLDGRQFEHHVGYTGYMDTYGLRGTDIVIQVAARMPRAAFHLVGGEPEVVDHWRRYAREHDRHGNVFFYGYRNPNEMPLFLSSFDVVVAPLQYRPLRRAPTGQNMSPLKLPQYLAYGKAIVASDLPAHRECLTQGETALLVPGDDIDAWVGAIEDLLGRPEKRVAMGRSAHASYERDYTPQIRVRRILEGLVPES
jgi:glycosyltransferase involved in cell wall biosynthesis